MSLSGASNEGEKSDTPDLRVESWPLERVLPYAKNARTHPPEQVEQIARSIDEFGFTNPVLVDAAGVLIAGHGRVLAAASRGLEQIPVIRLGHLSPEQARAYRLADNRLAEGSRWDEQTLRLELGELASLEGFGDLELMGFDLAFLEAPGEGQGAPRMGSLAEAFGIPPFSVLNAREGWWQDRKRAWIALGIQSELGRGEDMRASPGGSPQPTVNKKTGKIARSDSRGRAIPGTDAGAKRKERGVVVPGNGWGNGGPARRDPQFYVKKRAWEKANGRKIGTAEFREKHWDGAG